MTAEEFDKILSLLRSLEHQIFTVTFRRRTDKVKNGTIVARAGDLRRMTCRLGVKKGVKGLDPTRRDRDRNNALVTVYEMVGEASQFKSIPVDSIVAINDVPVREGL